MSGVERSDVESYYSYRGVSFKHEQSIAFERDFSQVQVHALYSLIHICRKPTHTFVAAVGGSAGGGNQTRAQFVCCL